MSARTPPRRRRGWKIFGIVLAVLVVALVAFRIALPRLVQNHVNRVLDEDPDYDGSIGEVDICIVCGRYAIHDIVIDETKGEYPVPLFAAEAVQFSVQWSELVRGSVVGEIELDAPQVNFVDSPQPGKDQTGTETDWREKVLELSPVRINRLAGTNGRIHYANFDAKPPVDVYIRDVEFEVRNLTNSEKISESLVATFWARGRPMGLGHFEVTGRLDPYADLPTFDMNLALREVDLVKLNDLFKAYAKVDVEAGQFDLFVELAAKDGRFQGYAKPVMRDVKVVDLQEETKEDREGPVRVAWETVVGAVKGVLENEPKDQVATRIPIEGSFDDPKARPWPAIGSALHNAFIEALFRGLDRDINWRDLTGAEPQG